MQSIRGILFGVALTVLPLGACTCDGKGGGSNNGSNNGGIDPDEMWAEPTHVAPEGCEGCEEISLGTLGHGSDGTFLVDREADDAISQWAKCLHSYMDCVDADGHQDSCVAGSTCPGFCKAEYARLAEGSGDDLEAKFAAIDDVFLNEGAPCKPEGVEGFEMLEAMP